ncbi:hypothetical protein [Nonomuraea sp. 10N515B]|uniref:hypothetical protein n=1 Tax=Nonomuraea sp. 10N515B TaxID=3457422 RepID=UPI003FCCB683
MNRREASRLDLVNAVISWVLGPNGGKVGGKSIVALVVVGLIVLVGFIGYRLLAFELIANLRN